MVGIYLLAVDCTFRDVPPANNSHICKATEMNILRGSNPSSCKRMNKPICKYIYSYAEKVVMINVNMYYF